MFVSNLSFIPRFKNFFCFKFLCLEGEVLKKSREDEKQKVVRRQCFLTFLRDFLWGRHFLRLSISHIYQVTFCLFPAINSYIHITKFENLVVFQMILKQLLCNLFVASVPILYTLKNWKPLVFWKTSSFLTSLDGIKNTQ